MVRHQHCIYHRLLLWLALNVRITSPNQLYYTARSPQEKPIMLPWSFCLACRWIEYIYN
jgi:hypothetical protein